MARDFAKKFYNSSAWKKCRSSYISKRISIDGGMCESCSRELGKIVHHKIWINELNINNPIITLSHDNLQYDCQTCHNQEKEDEVEKPRYRFIDGELILLKEDE